MQENFVFPHKLSRFLVLKDYQKDLGEVDMKVGLDGKSMKWSLEKHLELAKKGEHRPLFNWVFDVGFICVVLLTVSFPNRYDTVS